ncbi:hypothetical protein LAZ67_3002154 [Cordylochernes scorpioides]|uniref:Integrase catalytic domain-containing protein n=1 Tax=Cordylochernes scorpioides TaxID=51811 RepID=A0ABY6K7V8_9ARAC|nr:hypothetical protein LAZ67_3002154 [Cordylochernes scorpioides]
MSKDIKQKVKTCPTCQLTKRPVGPTYGELSQPPESKEPFDLLSLDTIAGFAKYGNTKIYLHVVVDHFSRYAWTFPSKSTSIITYQQVLKRVLQDGSPKRLLTDRAPAFTSPKFRSFLLNRNIHPLLTTSNNAQANGLCERLNATLTGKLRLLHLENPKVAWTKLVKKCADAFRMLTVAYGEATMSRSNVYRWYKMFSEGREDVNDEERAGRPSTSTTDEKINEVEKMILANRRITVREVAEDLNISIGSCHSIFINDLGMRRVAAKFVPKLLNCDQKQHRMNIANEMLDSVRDDPNLLQRVITGDEAWVYGYDVETKAQSSQWKLPHEPRPKKSAPSSVECESFADSFLRLQGRGAS